MKLTTLFCSILICLILYCFASVQINVTSYFNYLKGVRVSLLNKQIGNPADYSPSSLAPGPAPIFLGSVEPSPKVRDRCKKTCGQSADVVFIDSNSEYFLNGTQLTEGYWCVPYTVECNLRTGFVVASPSRQVCLTKFPNMFGGAQARDIVACNNEHFPATGSSLWDGLLNQPVDPETVIMNSEDEQLANGKPRFYCMFGKDVHNNAYVAHPFNRFHPMRNFCSQNLFSAHPDVQLVLSSDSGKHFSNWYCDCGDPSITQVRQPNGERYGQSPCSSCLLTKNIHEGGGMRVPYSCYTKYSPLSAVLTGRPCQLPERFSNVSSVPCETFILNIGEVTPETRLAPGLPFRLPDMADIDSSLNSKRTLVN